MNVHKTDKIYMNNMKDIKNKNKILILIYILNGYKGGGRAGFLIRAR